MITVCIMLVSSIIILVSIASIDSQNREAQVSTCDSSTETC